MRCTRSLALASVLALTSSGTILAQLPAPLTGRVQLEGFLSEYRADRRDAAADRLSGGGARLLWRLVAPGDSTRASLARRTAAGVFVVRANAFGASASAWHAGLQLDVAPVPTPVAGRLEPILSLGVGALRERSFQRPTWQRPGLLDDALHVAPYTVGDVPIPLPGGRHEVRTSPTVAPAIGVRFGIRPGMSLRTDVRDVIILRGTPRHAIELAAGVGVVL